jgi:hypothetical protein
MSDDDRDKTDPIHTKATVPVKSPFADEDLADTANVHTRDEIRALIEQSRARARQGIPDEADSTAMMSRDAIFRNAARDRAQRNDRLKTVPVEAIEAITAERVTRPARPSVRPAQADDPDATLERRVIDTTSDFVENGVGAVFPEGNELEYVGRVDGTCRVPIPPELATEIDLKPGDLVIVSIKKVES